MNPLQKLFKSHTSDSDFDAGYNSAVSDFQSVLEGSALKINQESLDQIGRIFYQAFKSQTVVSEMILQPGDVTIQYKEDSSDDLD